MNKSLHFETVRQLKDEYGIGSRDALAYSRAQTAYTDLRDRLIGVLREHGIDYRPLVREVANMCDSVRLVAEETLRVRAAEKVLEAGPGYTEREFHVLGPHRFYAFAQHDKHLGEEQESIPVSFDYETFLASFFAHYATTRDVDTALRRTVRVCLADETAYFRRGEWTTATFGEAAVDTEFLIEPYEHPTQPEDTERREEQKGQFAGWLRGETPYDLAGGFQPSLGAPTSEELKYLYNLGRFITGEKGVYTRAVRDQTLNRPETQRRIALANVMHTLADFPGLSPQEVIDMTLSELNRSEGMAVSGVSEMTEKLRSEKVHPQPEADKMFRDMLRGGIQLARESAEKTTYYQRVVKDHHDWLASYLAR